MKIVAVGPTALDIEFSCLATLSKFSRDGHEVHIIVMTCMNSNVDWMESEAKTFFMQFGLKNILFMKKRDYSKVTQDNAAALNLHIQRLTPDIVIMPFWRSLNQTHRIISRTALIACRGVGSILMYELCENPVFSPTITFQIVACGSANSSNHNNNNVAATESFDSHRMLLVEHSWL